MSKIGDALNLLSERLDEVRWEMRAYDEEDSEYTDLNIERKHLVEAIETLDGLQ